MVTKSGDWEERLISMSDCPGLWLTMTKYGYRANPAIDMECEVLGSNRPPPNPNPNTNRICEEIPLRGEMRFTELLPHPERKWG